MPLFEYRCNECGRRFSLLLGVTGEKAELRCPRCGSRKATKLISRIAPISREEDLDDLGESDLDEGEEEFGDYGEDSEEDLE